MWICRAFRSIQNDNGGSCAHFYSFHFPELHRYFFFFSNFILTFCYFLFFSLLEEQYRRRIRNEMFHLEVRYHKKFLQTTMHGRLRQIFPRGVCNNAQQASIFWRQPRGSFKQESSFLFARWDSGVHVPLCLFLCTSFKRLFRSMNMMMCVWKGGG